MTKNNYAGEWRVVINRRANRRMRRLPKNLSKRLRQAIDQLRNDPRPHGAIRLVGTGDLYRIPVGDWRIIYTIRDDELLILVVQVAPRGSAYQNL